MKTLYGLKIYKDGKVYKGFKRLKPHKTRSGYLQVQFSFKGRKMKKYIHRLVAEGYCKKPNKKNIDLCVDHINCNKLDNRSVNLRWCTYKENLEYAKKNGLISKTAKNKYRPPRTFKRNILKKVLSKVIFR